MRKRLRQAHEQAVAHRLRDQSLALVGILLPLLSLSLLQAFAVTEAVRVQYDQALVELLLWLKSQGVSRIQTVAGLDVALVSYFDSLAEHLTPFAVGEKCIAALAHRLPCLRGSSADKFPGATRPLKGWRRLYPSRTRPPLPFAAAVLLAALMVARGLPSMAVAILRF